MSRETLAVYCKKHDVSVKEMIYISGRKRRTLDLWNQNEDKIIDVIIAAVKYEKLKYAIKEK